MALDLVHRQRIDKLRDDIVQLVRTRMKQWELVGVPVNDMVAGALTATAHSAAQITVGLTGPENCGAGVTLLTEQIDECAAELAAPKRRIIV